MNRAYRLGVALWALGALPAAVSAAVYSVQLDSSAFGAVKQSDVPAANGPSGVNSCAPTAMANAFAWLQQAFPGAYGTALVGAGTYSAVQQAGTTLASDMSTSSTNGTYPPLWVSGEVSYLESARPGQSVYGGMGLDLGVNTTAYPWFVNANPTFNLLYDALEENAAVEVGMLPTGNGIGHVVTLTGLYWNDANGNGIIDFNEGATMTYVDPATGLTGTSDIGQLSLNGAIQTDYYQAGQDSGVLVMATWEVGVPEPASLAMLALGAAALLVRRRQRAQRGLAATQFMPKGS